MQLNYFVIAIPATEFWKIPILVNRKERGIPKIWNGKPSKTVLCLQKKSKLQFEAGEICIIWPPNFDVL